MRAFELEDRSGVTILWLDKPPVNALDLEVLNELVDVLEEIERRPYGGIVLTGRGEAFSAGADLVRVLAEGDDYVRDSVAALSRAFGALFTFPRPVVAAVNGHAIAGGAILTSACDHKVMGAKGSIGVTELRVGVPFPLYALEIVRFAVAPQHFQEAILRAKTYSPSEGLRLGFVDELAGDHDVVDVALKRAQELARIPADTFRLMKQALRRPTVDRVERHAADHDAASADLWASQEVRASIERFLDAVLNRPRG